MSANLENLAMATGLEKLSFHSNSKVGQCQRIFQLPCNCATSHTNEVTAKIILAGHQQYMNWGLSDIEVEFRKGRETRNQIAKVHWFIEKAREFQNIYFCFINYIKAFDCLDQKNCGKFLQLGVPDHLICLLRNLYVGQEAAVRTRHGNMKWFKIGERLYQGCIMLSCLFNLYTVYIRKSVLIRKKS